MQITDQTRANTAAQMLLIACAASAGLAVLWLLGSFLPHESLETFDLIQELLWLGVAGFTIVALIQFSGAVEDKTWPMITAIAWIVMALFDVAVTVLQTTERHGTLGIPYQVMRIFYDASTLVSLAARAIFFVFLIRVTMATRAWVLPLLALAFLFSLARNAMSFAVSHEFTSYEIYLNPFFRYGSQLAALYTATVVVISAWAVQQAVKGASVVPAGAAAGLVPAPVVETASPTADFVIGGILLLVGVGVTVVSMSAASSGGRYVVATGAIGVGLGRIIRGLIRLGKNT